MTPVGAGDRPRGGEVRRYGGAVIGVHWAFMLTFLPLLFTGTLLMRDWFNVQFKVYGVHELLPTPAGTLQLHIWLGLAVLVIGAVHIALHINQREKHIIPRDVGKDLAGALHNILYMLHLSRIEERGAHEKYRGEQRMTYVALLYTVSLAAITAGMAYAPGMRDLAIVMHVIAGVLLLWLALYRVLGLVRKHDGVALRSILWKGTMPEWYVKKNHILWWRQLGGRYAPPPDIDFDALAEVPPAVEVVEGEE